MLLGISATSVAETRLTVDNDGLVLSAIVSSSKDVLSTSLRVVGPDGFVFEDRIEDSALQWIPEGDLADGIYQWEARTLTLDAGAPAREFTLPAQRPADTSQNNQQVEVTTEKNLNADAQTEIPLERYFEDAYKNVTIKSGSFRVRDGFLEPLQGVDEVRYDDGAMDVGTTNEPSMFGTIAGAFVDFLFPSAHAADVDNLLQIQDATPNGDTHIFFDSDGSSNWWLQNDNGSMKFKEFSGGSTDHVTIESGGEMGLGTTTPTQPIHIADPFPRIRIEDTTDAQSWFIKNVSAGTFEIGESAGGGGAFEIQPTAAARSLTIGESAPFCDPCVGIGTDTPARNIHIAAPNASMFFEDTNSGDRWQFWNNAGVFQFNHHSTGRTPFRIEGGAPTDSIRVAADGNVGIGTQTPDSIFNVQRNDGTSGSSSSVQLLVENTTGVTANRDMMRLTNNGGVQFKMDTGGAVWNFAGLDNSFVINDVSVAGVPLRVFSNGNMTINGTLTESSSRTVKHDIQPLENIEVLQKLTSLEISRWRYDSNPDAAHVGPMAEDWYDVFGLGDDNRSVAPRDLAGVALAAAKALREENLDLRARLDDLEGKIRDTF